MLLKLFHVWRIKEIQKLTAIRTLSPRLNPVLFFCCHCQKLPPTSAICFTHQTIKFPLLTSFVATGPSAAAAAYDSCSPEPDPISHFENPNLNVESLRESSDEEHSSVFTCVSEDGTCYVYVVPRHSSQELCGEVVNKITHMEPKWLSSESYPADASMLESLKRKLKRNPKELCGEVVNKITYMGPKWLYPESYPADASMLESLKRNPKVVNKLEVHPKHGIDVAYKEAKKYGGKVMPGDLSEQVPNMLEVYLGHGFRLAYEEGAKFMRHHFPLLQVILWGTSLSKKIILASLFFRGNLVINLLRISPVETLLYLAVAVAWVFAILSGISPVETLRHGGSSA